MSGIEANCHTFRGVLGGFIRDISENLECYPQNQDDNGTATKWMHTVENVCLVSMEQDRLLRHIQIARVGV